MVKDSPITKIFTACKRENCPNTEFFGPYFPLFRLNTEKYEPKKPRIWTLFTQRFVISILLLDSLVL